MRSASWFVALGVLGACAAVRADTVQQGLRVPDGFEVTEYAGSGLANDIFCMTIDPHGRVIVSGRGYTRILIDDGKGRAVRAVDFIAGPKDGAMGLLWEGDSLFVVGDGGLRRYREGGGKPELIRVLKTGGEHDSHALRRGPDGWLYLLCGNNAGIDRKFAQLPTSPIQEPVAGCVVRFEPKLKKSEIVADGFRNPYGMDFNTDGELFTFDSDNERCVSLPWYEPTRFYHIVPGGHYGWQAPQHAQFWRRPPYFPDVVAPVATCGRGSPTGVACYRHAQFPPAYRGGFFLADWTFGRIYFVPLERVGTAYKGKPRVFLQSVGDNGFAPTALAVHPKTGDLFVSIGGRGTRGAVYRIHYTKNDRPVDPAEVARLQPRPRPPDWRPSQAKELADRARAESDADLSRGMKSHGKSRLAAVRAVQLKYGGITAAKWKGTVFEGYSPRDALAAGRAPGEIRAALRGAFPSGDADLDRELSRTLAILQDDDTSTPGRMCDKLAAGSDPVEDVHYLIVLARLRGAWDEKLTRHVAGALLALDRKLTERHDNRDTNWPLRITELYAEMVRKHPELNAALLDEHEFGRPDHVLFARASGFDRHRAAKIFLSRAKEESFTWTPALVRLVGELPDEQALPALKPLWGKGGLDEALLPVLARKPEPADRAKFIAGLKSLQPVTVGTCLDALAKLAPPKEGADLLVIVRCLQRLPEGKEGDALRQRVGKYLERVTGREKMGGDRKRWGEWFVKTYPKLAPRLDGADGVDVASWRKRLAALDWSAGDAEHGKAVFVKASCAVCHSGAQALGPDLHGVTGRFSRDDLFTAILLPSKDISPRYRTTAVTLSDGKSYQGLVIYDATDSLILQTGADTTVRVPAEKVESRRFSDVSLMPAGLLDALKDQEIADLYAYLKGLGK